MILGLKGSAVLAFSAERTFMGVSCFALGGD